MAIPYYYRGCKIERIWVTKSGPPQPDEWGYGPVNDQDADEHNQGHGSSVEDCKEYIDEMLDG